MSNPTRNLLLRKTTLEALGFAKGYALPDATLRSHVDALLRPPLSGEEWTITTAWLESERLVVRVPNDLDAALIQWAITERGRVLLSTL